jgi:membrane protein YqaA with SNARE-associated domain
VWERTYSQFVNVVIRLIEGSLIDDIGGRAVIFLTLLLMLSSTWVRAGLALLLRMGALGLFLLGVCDSSFFFLPFSNDLLLIALISRERHSWQWMIYTLSAALGSVAGVALLDMVMRKVGREGLDQFIGQKKLERLQGKIESRGVWTVFLATLLPPPFPFTAVIAAASVFQLTRRKMLAAVFAGRLVRYTAVSLLALYFGRRLLRYLRSDYIEYLVYGLIAVAVIGTFLTVLKWLQTRSHQAVAS